MQYILTALLLFLISGDRSYAQNTQKQERFQINHIVNYHDTTNLSIVTQRLKDIIYKYYDKEVQPTLFGVKTNQRWWTPNAEAYYLTYETGTNTKEFYTPDLLALQKLDTNLYRAKVAFTWVDSFKNTYINSIYNFVLMKDHAQFYFLSIVDFMTKDWKSTTIKDVTFRYKNSHKFDKRAAKRTVTFNDSLARFFEIPSIKFDFYVADNCEELYRIQGFDYNYLMYSNNQFSGQADVVNKMLFSGNNSEWYPHEQVHLYVYGKFNVDKYSVNRLFDEGMATWLGGSSGKDLDWHIDKLKTKLTISKIDLNNFLTEPKVVSDSANLDYTVGGILVRAAFERYGKEKLWLLIENSQTEEQLYQNICSTFGIKRDKVGDLILKLLEKR